MEKDELVRAHLSLASSSEIYCLLNCPVAKVNVIMHRSILLSAAATAAAGVAVLWELPFDSLCVNI